MRTVKMRLLQFLLLLTLSILVGANWFATRIFSSRAQISNTQSAFAKREAAYRANNIGVALLEQYQAKEAVESFTRALEIKPDLLIARINLAIALYYLPDAVAARREAESVLKQDANSPQPHYILGLIARAQNRLDDAVTEFQMVLKVDSSDAGTNVNLGQIFIQQKKQTEAIASFLKAVDSEPYNETALYNLGLLLTRTGKREEGQQLIQRFQQLKASGAGIALGTNYLEGGRYAAAVTSTGLEPELVDHTSPDVRLVDVTRVWLAAASDKPELGGDAVSRAEPIVLFDYDNDGDMDILDASSPQQLLRNDRARFADVSPGSGLHYSGPELCSAAVAGDYDNDGKPDLFLMRGGRFFLQRNEGGGHFSDRTKEAGLDVRSDANSPYGSCAFVDVDHDGDLDLFIAGPPNILFRNNSNGTFTNITESAGLKGQKSGVRSTAVVPTDFDNRRDVDLLVLNRTQNPPALFRNLRDGTFSDVADSAGLGQKGDYSCVAAGDINKDEFTDFFLGSRSDRGHFAMSTGKGRFRFIPAPSSTKGAQAAQFVDYDNDGLLDLILITNQGLQVWRSTGETFADESRNVSPALQKLYSSDSLWLSSLGFASGDLDGDGDIDLVMRGAKGELRVARNDGGNQNRSLTVSLHGRVSNKSALGLKVELRSGSLYQKLETYSASPAPAPSTLIFGLGKRERPDAVRVIWPAGILQAETEFPPPMPHMKLNITELDRKPSSCPYLYTWNGERFEFITDFMGGGEMGYLEEPGRRSVVALESVPRAVATGSEKARYNNPDPTEYVRIRGDQLRAKDGRYELRVTNELEEAMFVDRLQLLVVAHPAGTDVYPNEGMSAPPKSFKLFMTKNAQPPSIAIDDKGNDVLDLISRMDRRWPDDFEVDRIRGYAAEHSLTLNLEDESKAQSRGSKGLLLLTGWTDYAWSSDNVAASQAGKEMKLPSLQVKDRAGKWHTVIDDIGIPVGRPQTVTVDLTGKFLSANREVRIVTNMRIYWDQILFASSTEESSTQITRLDPMRADLRWRGFSAEVTPDGAEPFGYDYQRVSFASPWKVMAGRYTREGDVRDLLLAADDMFVISRTGDEIALSFDAARLPALPNGWTRTFLLYADGFSKEMDINSASPDQLAPMPFHAMTRYPYTRPEHYPSDRKHLEYLEKYNTRVVRSQVPLIDAAILGR